MTSTIEGEAAATLLRSDPRIKDLFADESIGEKLSAIAQVRDYGYHDVLLDADRPADLVGYVLEGAVAIQKRLNDGRVQFVGFLSPTDLYGRLFDGPMHYDLVALSDTRVAAFDKAKFEELVLESPALERRCVLDLLNELDAAREWLTLLGRRKVGERVATFLVILMSRRRDQSTMQPIVKIPIKRSDLAHYLGVRTESISRALHSLERKGVLELQDPYTVRILDPAALENASGADLLTGLSD